MKKVIPAVIVLLIIIGVTIFFIIPKEKQSELNESSSIVTNLYEKVGNNSLWCGTFQLVWNELKDNLNSGKNIEFITGNSEEVKNLNKSYFTKKDVDEKSYYIKYGEVNEALKEEIEEAIKTKFNEKSDILNDFDWTPQERSYLVYSMLIKNIEFPQKFEKLNNGDFNGVKDVKYFGIKEKQSELKRQVKVLYYNDKNNYAIELSSSKTKDVIVLEKGSKKESFIDIYNEVTKNAEKYSGSSFSSSDQLMIPYLEINSKQFFKQFVGKQFNGNGMDYEITQAVQTIKFKMDESGAKLKSEAGIGMKELSLPDAPRYFNFNSDFTLFMKDDKLPYLAIKVNDIKDFQDIK